MRGVQLQSESCCPAAFRHVPAPAQLNQMVGLPRQRAIKFGKDLQLSFDSCVSEQGFVEKLQDGSARGLELETPDVT